MTKSIRRREFLKKGSQACVACCFLCFGSESKAISKYVFNNFAEPIDPKNLNYCGYKCPPDCPFLQASEKNDTELKKEVYEKWQLKERYNIEFEPDRIFCFGCKNKEKPEGVELLNCTVRQCVISKKLDCCVECHDLSGCQKELWSRFPEFKKQVIEMQKQYMAG